MYKRTELWKNMDFSKNLLHDLFKYKMHGQCIRLQLSEGSIQEENTANLFKFTRCYNQHLRKSYHFLYK